MNTIDISRFEFKYLLTPDEAPGVRRFLLRYCVPDVNAEGTEWYAVQSLYLDTPDYRLFRASSEQAVERLKLRVRSYSNGTGPVKLEVKRRIGDVVRKSSFMVTHDVWNKFGSRGAAAAVHESSADCLPFLHLIEKIRATPKVLVKYHRHALHSQVDDYVRATFDRRIVSQSMPEWDLIGDPRRWSPVDDPPSFHENRSAYVLELKFQVRPPVWLGDMVRSFGLVRRGFSKYVRAVQRLNTDRDTAWDLRTAPSVASPWVWRLA